MNCIKIKLSLTIWVLICSTPFLFAQSWETLANIPVNLSFPVVVSLNGNIHVMGGGAPGGATDLHLRYKPASNTWDTMAPVPYKAQQPAGAVVKGKIHYFGGGFPNSGTRLAWHYVYDPDSNLWHAAASLPVAVAIHKAASIDNKLMSMAGQPDKEASNTFIPDSNKWVANNPLPDQNFWYGAIVSANNELYRFGGGGYTSPTRAAHKYNKATDAWESLPDFPEANHSLAGASIGDSIILSGGYVNMHESNRSWVYHIKTKTYQEVTWLPIARNYLSMVSIGNCVYSVGGNKTGNTSVGVSLLRICSDKISAVDEVKRQSNKLIISQNERTIKIEFNEVPVSKNIQVTLYDVSGKLLLSKNMLAVDTAVELNTESFGPSCFIIQVIADDKTYTHKVVLN